jgi:hypothetical protein
MVCTSAVCGMLCAVQCVVSSAARVVAPDDGFGRGSCCTLHSDATAFATSAVTPSDVRVGSRPGRDMNL